MNGDPNHQDTGLLPHDALTSNEYKDLLAKYSAAQADIRALRLGIKKPPSPAKTALIISGTVVGVGLISVGANKLWGWAFPPMQETRRRTTP